MEFISMLAAIIFLAIFAFIYFITEYFYEIRYAFFRAFEVIREVLRVKKAFN